jgi:TonB family protein
MQNLARTIGWLVLFVTCAVLCLTARPSSKAEKPLNHREVQDLVENYVPSERIIELIHQFGIDFEPSEQYLKDLRKAGADSELIGALRAVTPRVPMVTVEQAESLKKTQKALQQAPLSYNQVSNLLVNHIPSDAISELVGKYGIAFDPNKENLKGLHGIGADPTLLAALRKAKTFTAPAAPHAAEPATESKKTVATTSGPATNPPAQTEEVKTAEVMGEPAVKTAPQPDAPKPQEQVAEPASQPPEHAGPYNVGGDVSPPTALYTPNAPYTEQARRGHLQGTVVLGIVINEHGKVTQIEELSKPLGMGLDESATQTVGSWVFRAAQFRGLPVPVRVNVKVEFHQQF